MVEDSAGPVDGRVTLRTVLREPRSLVGRVVGAVPIGLMATEARGTRQVKVIVHMAGVAGDRAVHAS